MADAKTHDVRAYGPIVPIRLHRKGSLAFARLRARDLAANRCIRHEKRQRLAEIDRRWFQALLDQLNQP